MDPQAPAALQQQQLADRLTIHTSHNVVPPPLPPRLSDHVATFIKDVLKVDDVEKVLAKPVIRPLSDTGRDLPLADHFVSSSHNTYLLSNQVLGRSSPISYTHVLSRGARCVEIDVWPSKNGPIVTHGHTFSQSIPFTSVCAAIGSSVQSDSWPVLVSLECHVYGEQQQQELVKIMKEGWGDKFIDGKLSDVDDTLTPGMVMGNILVMVEYYPPPIAALVGSGDAPPDSSSSSSSSSSESDDGDGASSFWPRRNKQSQVPHHLRISPDLAAVGYYLRSMKPSKNWFSRLFPDPPNILLNISESSLLALLTSSQTILQTLITHAQTHIRRIYPKGLRLTSSNLHPHTFWGTGSQVVALNWQRYDLGMQLNEAMFVGTPGWVAKPAWMRRGASAGSGGERRLKIRGEVIGICSTPPPSDRQRTSDSKPYNAYLKAQLITPAASAALCSARELEYRSDSQAVQPINGDLNFSHPGTSNNASSLAEELENLWRKKTQKDQKLPTALFEWEIYEKWEELTFLRLSVCEKEFGKDDTLSVFCARVADIRRAVFSDEMKGWGGVRMLDLSGKNSGSLALVQFVFEPVFPASP